MPIITRRIFHLRSKPQLGGAGSQPLNVSDVTVYSYRPSLLLGFLHGSALRLRHIRPLFSCDIRCAGPRVAPHDARIADVMAFAAVRECNSGEKDQRASS
jgi:hypothetical protein